MGHRNKSQARCVGCRLPMQSCLCPDMPRLHLETRILLIMHCREWLKPTATGSMALAALPNHELHLHGQKDHPLDLAALSAQEGTLLLLFPSDEAAPIEEAKSQAAGRPLSLIVPDGNWQQARRLSKRLMTIPDVVPVGLPPGPTTQWGVRRETRPGGLATFEAIARALGVLEGPAVQSALEGYFRLMVATTNRYRNGVDRCEGWTSAEQGAPS